MYQDLYPRVLAYATSLVGRQTGEDITSETFTVAWQRWGDLPSARLPWLLGVARNLIRELRRRDARQYRLAVAEGRRVSTGGGDVAADVAERTSLLRALAELPDTDRELLTLVAWHGLTHAEAARVLHCTTATLTVRLHRARRRLERAVAASSPSRDNPQLVTVKES
jgi:RNA polymerase sigma-70 factor (ECF subfamily)